MLTRMHSQITCIYGSLQLSEKLSEDFKIDKKCFPRLDTFKSIKVIYRIHVYLRASGIRSP